MLAHPRVRAVALPFAAIGILLSIPSDPARADIVWNETIHGDLSNDRLAPTPITLGVGVNSIIATSVTGDREYLTFTLASGLQLTAVNLVSYVGDDPQAFIAVQAGSTLTEPPTGTNVANLLGWTHFGPAVGNVGTDVLDDMAIGLGAIGFAPPLPSGPYTFWMQQTGPVAATFQFDFIVTPAPGAMGLLLMLTAMPPAARRRSR